MAGLIAASVPVDVHGSGLSMTKAARDSGKKTKSSREAVYHRRALVAPGSPKSYAQAGWLNFKRHGILAGADRTARQLIYRSQSRKLNSLLASAARGFAGDLSETFAQYEVVLNFSNAWAAGRPGG